MGIPKKFRGNRVSYDEIRKCRTLDEWGDTMESEAKEENIYTTVPEGKIDESVKEESHKVLNHLKANEGKFMTARDIAIAVGFPTKGTQVEVRKAITELIEIQGQPIISVGKGFTFTNKKGMVSTYADNLENRKQGLERRIKAVRKIAEQMKDE